MVPKVPTPNQTSSPLQPIKCLVGKPSQKYNFLNIEIGEMYSQVPKISTKLDFWQTPTPIFLEPLTCKPRNWIKRCWNWYWRSCPESFLLSSNLFASKSPVHASKDTPLSIGMSTQILSIGMANSSRKTSQSSWPQNQGATNATNQHCWDTHLSCNSSQDFRWPDTLQLRHHLLKTCS